MSAWLAALANLTLKRLTLALPATELVPRIVQPMQRFAQSQPLPWVCLLDLSTNTLALWTRCAELVRRWVPDDRNIVLEYFQVARASYTPSAPDSLSLPSSNLSDFFS